MADTTQNPVALTGGAPSLFQGGFNAIGPAEYGLGAPSYWKQDSLGAGADTAYDWQLRMPDPTQPEGLRVPNNFDADSLGTGGGSGGSGGADNAFAVAGAVSSIAQSLGSMASTYFQAKAAKKVAAAQERIEKANQQVAELAAHMALQRSAWNIGQLSMRAAQIKASQRVSQGASGTRVGVGSNAAILASTDIMKEIDINQEYVNGYREAWSVRMHGVQASMRATAAGAYGASISPAASSFVTGVNGLLQTYKDYRKEFS